MFSTLLSAPNNRALLEDSVKMWGGYGIKALLLFWFFHSHPFILF